ncbi:uncharacterized protein LOC8079043 [Sorghum bicolor]|uniref:Uncharacterized protein n=1 Tax=Sorghum bicolor TaxID=4558 RepID=A0A1B6Q2A0_SORBI|nr:uncharacterized protein LOC8079043 [Sorghum bicolor]KXG32030.1 hypothetical protein SORBI_3003G093000 [Sorghum bicolor]|eukprot:XP_002455284.2 uncharacterized protein LOC8079043 [Sorghum bicolor]
MHPMTTSCEFAAVLALRSNRSRPSSPPPPLLPASVANKKPAASSSTSTRRWRCASSRRDDDADEFSCNGTGGGGGGGRMVDEGMVVLRRRIHEMEAPERGWEPPQEWAAWEKEWYATYDADVCHLLGVLQAFLVSSRPGVGVGLVAVLALAVPASAFVLVSLLLDASRAIVSSLHQ